MIAGKKILADGRWRGAHGIGRFATEVLDRLDGVQELRGGLRKLHPLDPLWLSEQIRKQKPQLFFSPGFNAPLYGTTPLVFTLHDLIHLREPAEGSLGKNLYYNMVVRPAARRAQRVVTGSEHARGEILEWSGLSEERVTAVQHGVSPAFFPDGDLFEPGYEYVLYVGNSKPHKNVDGLIRGLAQARQTVDVELVLVGTEERLTQAWAQQQGIAEQVHTMMILTDEQLASVYRNARALVLPSRNEGFGLPVIEAMACGTPVVASNRSAVPEAAGDAAILVDPMDAEALAAALVEVCESTPLRENLRAKGLARVQGCTWERTGQQVARILEESLLVS